MPVLFSGRKAYSEARPLLCEQAILDFLPLPRQEARQVCGKNAPICQGNRRHADAATSRIAGRFLADMSPLLLHFLVRHYLCQDVPGRACELKANEDATAH